MKDAVSKHPVSPLEAIHSLKFFYLDCNGSMKMSELVPEVF